VAAKDAQAWFQKGQAALQSGDLAGAEQAFHKVLTVDPTAGAAYANLGVVAMRRKQWDQALKLLRKAQRLSPKITGIRLNIGLVEFHRGNYPEAIGPFESVVKDQPDSLQANYLLGFCYTFVRRYSEAVQMLQPLWPQMSSQFVYLYALSNAANRSGNKELDQRAMARLVEIGSDTAEFHLLMGKALLNRNDDVKALEELRKAEAANPNLPFLHFYLGMAFRRLSQPDEAEKEFHKDIEAEPDTGYNYEQLGKLYMQMGRREEAEHAFAEALKQEPRLPDSLTELAKFHLGRGELEQARKEIDAAVKLAPESQSAHLARGQVLQKLGKKDDAKLEFDVARKLLAEGVERDRAPAGAEVVPDPDNVQQP
jgi:tetratricopeptide (TPR) repeat protein